MIQGKSSGGNHTMEMGMMRQGLTPGVKDGEESDLGSEAFGIGRHLHQSLGNSAK